jgi:hypothetical protein
MKILLITLTILLLTACGEDDSTPESITRDYMERTKAFKINMVRRLVDKEDIPFDEEASDESAKKTKAMLAPGFSYRKLNRPPSLIERHLLDHYKDNYDGLTIDIGDAKTDGGRAKVSAYIGSDECVFSFSKIENKWLLSDLACTRYQYQ